MEGVDNTLMEEIFLLFQNVLTSKYYSKMKLVSFTGLIFSGFKFHGESYFKLTFFFFIIESVS